MKNLREKCTNVNFEGIEVGVCMEYWRMYYRKICSREKWKDGWKVII
jgi:hypothetical protein